MHQHGSDFQTEQRVPSSSKVLSPSERMKGQIWRPLVTAEWDGELCILYGVFPSPTIQLRIPRDRHNGTKPGARSESSQVVLGTVFTTELADLEGNQEEPGQDLLLEEVLESAMRAAEGG